MAAAAAAAAAAGVASATVAGRGGVMLITGANRGLGFELARTMLRAGGVHVIAGARKWTREAGSPWNVLDAAAAEARKVPTRAVGALSFVELDVASDASRYALAGQLAAVLGTEQRLNVVVNNAGVYLDGWTPDAFRTSLATNTLGPLALATELKPFYGGDAHVINVSTGLAKLSLLSPAYRAAVTAATSVADLTARLAFIADDAMKDKSVPTYKVAKAALNHGTRLLAASLAGVARVNCVDPGWCATDMGGKTAPRTPLEGARSIQALVLGAPEVIGTGHYYDCAGARTTW